MRVPGVLRRLLILLTSKEYHKLIILATNSLTRDFMLTITQAGVDQDLTPEEEVAIIEATDTQVGMREEAAREVGTEIDLREDHLVTMCV